MFASQAFGAGAFPVGDRVNQRTMMLVRDEREPRGMIRFGLSKDKSAGRREWYFYHLIDRAQQHRALRQPPDLGMERFVQLQILSKALGVERYQIVELGMDST